MKMEAKGSVLTSFMRRLSGRESEPSRQLIAEAAIEGWENDGERNPEGYKIVRGLDGKPVEVISEGAHEGNFAILVNGKKEQFQIGGSMRTLEQTLGQLMFQQFLNGDVFNNWYELEGIQRLDVDVSPNHQGFVFGTLSQTPDEFEVHAAGK